MPDAFCPQHGPYNASLGACPYCSSEKPRPSAPPSLDDEETDPGGGTAPTQPPPRGGYGRGSGEEGETELPQSRRIPRRIYDDEEATELPRRLLDEDDIDATELEEPPSLTQGMLWVKEGPRRGKFYPIKHGTVVGRKEGSLILTDPKVSSRHAKFTVEDGDFLIWDLASANGTYVNGKKIRGATELSENDVIKIGDTVFVVKLLEPKTKRKSSLSSGKRSKPAAKGADED